VIARFGLFCGPCPNSFAPFLSVFLLLFFGQECPHCHVFPHRLRDVPSISENCSLRRFPTVCSSRFTSFNTKLDFAAPLKCFFRTLDFPFFPEPESKRNTPSLSFPPIVAVDKTPCSQQRFIPPLLGTPRSVAVSFFPSPPLTCQ